MGLLNSPQEAVTYHPPGTECLLVTSLGYSKSTYKVVIIPYANWWRTEFDIQVFSSDTGEWNTYKILSEKAVKPSYEMYNYNGCLFWQENNKIRIFNLNNIDDKKLSSSSTDDGWIQSIDIPPSGYNWYSFLKLGISEGFIIFRVLDTEARTFSIWVLKEGCSHGGWVWSLHKNINVEHHPGPPPKFFYFCPVNLDVVIFRNSGHWCCFNLGTADCDALIQFPALSTAIEYSRPYLIYTPKVTII